jgi:hypothetical protein
VTDCPECTQGKGKGNRMRENKSCLTAMDAFASHAL